MTISYHTIKIHEQTTPGQYSRSCHNYINYIDYILYNIVTGPRNTYNQSIEFRDFSPIVLRINKQIINKYSPNQKVGVLTDINKG